MTTSTDGQICYGVRFDEDTEFPWDSEEWDGEIDSWWLYAVCEYKNPFELYDKQGNWLNGEEAPKDRISEYYKVMREFEDSHPLPVELVNYCSCDYPEYIIAIPRTCRTAYRGYPKKFSPSELCVTEEEIRMLENFCRNYNLENGEFGWWLSSYWG